MMDFQFERRTDILVGEDEKQYFVYGFDVIACDGTVLLEFPDVAFEPEIVEELIHTFIRENISFDDIKEKTIRAIEAQYTVI